MNTIGRKTIKAKTSAAKSVKASANGVGASAPSFEAIAKRSYEIYLSRGGETGHEVEDWLTAEAELSGKRLS